MYAEKVPSELSTSTDSIDVSDYKFYKRASSIRKDSIKNTNIRWLVLLFASLGGVGNYYCLDSPQPLESAINDTLHTSNLQFGLFYSIYGFPNMILPLFGGIIVDRLGARIGIAIFSLLLVIGQIITTFGAFHTSFTVMLIGRAIFALGGENFGVAICCIISKWFKGNELSFSLGAMLCMGRMGSSLNSFVSPKLYNYSGELWVPLLFGAGLCLMSWTSGLTLIALDLKAERHDRVHVTEPEHKEIPKLRDFKEFSLLFYLILLNGFFMYGGFYGLNANLNNIIDARFGFDPSSAGNFISIVCLFTAIFFPITGYLTDIKGKRILLINIATIVFMASHFGFAFLPAGTRQDPNYATLLPLVGVGFYYAIYAGIYWPCIPLTVPEKLTGTAFGIANALQNLMMAVVSLSLGYIHDNTMEDGAGYFWTEICLAALAGCGLLTGIWMYIVDIKTGGVLDKPACTDEEPEVNIKEPLITEVL